MRKKPEVPVGATPDIHFVERAREGDKEAFAPLFDRYKDRVYRLAYRLCGNGADAEEVLQECFLSVFRRLHQFRGESKFSTWLFRIATNAALMHNRARSARHAESLEEYMPQFNASGRHKRIDEDFSAAARVEKAVTHRELKELLLKALQQLPAKYRSAIVLKDLDEMSSADAAEVLSIDETTLRQRVHRGRLILRAVLQEAARRAAK